MVLFALVFWFPFRLFVLFLVLAFNGCPLSACQHVSHGMVMEGIKSPGRAFCGFATTRLYLDVS